MASEIFGEQDSKTRNFVRWYNPQCAGYQEDSVEIFLESTIEATIWTVNRLVTGSSVYIKTDSYSGNGIVSHSKPEEKGYQVVIRLDCENVLSPQLPPFDPGVLALDGFLTEEEENKIFESLGDELEVDSDIDETPSDAFNLGEALKSVLVPGNRLAFATGAVVEGDDWSNRLQ